MSYEYTVTMPSTLSARKRSQFRDMVREMGGSISKGKKMEEIPAYERALEDVSCGRVSRAYDDLGALFADLNS